MKEKRNQTTRKIVALILIFSVIAFSSTPVLGDGLIAKVYSAAKAEEVAERLFEAVEIKDWAAFTNCMSDAQKSYFDYYFSDETLDNGIKQVENLEIIHLYSIANQLAEGEWLVDEYPVLLSDAEIYTVIAEVDCEVNKENQYFHNGVNYFLLVLVAEETGLNVIQFNKPSAELAEKVMELNVCGQSEDERNGLNVLEAAEYGLVVNASGEMLTEGFEVVTATTEIKSSTLAADPPVIHHYTSYSYPTEITVLLNKTGNNKTKTVGFTEYMKNVLPNEWIPSWHTNSLKAGAYCVKMVGIYRAVNPMSSVGAYNLSQSTQNYTPGTATYTATSNAIDSIIDKGMANSSGKLFFPRYEAGQSGEAGSQSSGRLQQYGSQFLANSKGYSCKKILNYYYSGSEYSSGDVLLFDYNFGF